MSIACRRLHYAIQNLPVFDYHVERDEIPLNGIYVLYEHGEMGHKGYRIVRVGTHIAQNHLRSRMQVHFVRENKEQSIFRKNIGRAILNSEQDPFLNEWNQRHATISERKRQVENEVSEYIHRNFQFSIILVDDGEERLTLEKKLIATISRCTECRPTRRWLGRFSPKSKIRESGLWQVQHLYKEPLSTRELEMLAERITQSGVSLQDDWYEGPLAWGRRPAVIVRPSDPDPPRCIGLDASGNILDESKLDRRLLDKIGFDIFMKPWLRKAYSARNNREWFEALIYLWVTFNAWTAQIIVNRRLSEHDSMLVQAAARDPDLAERFESLRSHDRRFRDICAEFYSLWPVFKVRALLDRGIEGWNSNLESRAEFREGCLMVGVERQDFRPRCYLQHQGELTTWDEVRPESVPDDWAHALSAIYQVRCNLFHGGKSFRESRDLKFARLAFEILWTVWGNFQLDDA